MISKVVSRALLLSFGDYLLSSGVKSPYYIDFSMLANRPDYLKIVNEIIIDFIRKKGLDRNVDRIVGISNKGMIFLTYVSTSLTKPFAYLNKHTGEIIMGDIKPDERILVIDDLINTGRTLKIVASKIAEAYHGEVSRVVVVIDREEGWRDELSNYNFKVYPIVRMRKLARTLLDMGAIGEDEYDIIIERIKKVKG